MFAFVEMNWRKKKEKKRMCHWKKKTS